MTNNIRQHQQTGYEKGNTMTHAIRLFMLFEAASFVAAALVHSDVLIEGYEHPQARIAEGVIAIVLLVGAVLTLDPPSLDASSGPSCPGVCPARDAGRGLHDRHRGRSPHAARRRLPYRYRGRSNVGIERRDAGTA